MVVVVDFVSSCRVNLKKKAHNAQGSDNLALMTEQTGNASDRTTYKAELQREKNLTLRF